MLSFVSPTTPWAPSPPLSVGCKLGALNTARRDELTVTDSSHLNYSVCVCERLCDLGQCFLLYVESRIYLVIRTIWGVFELVSCVLRALELESLAGGTWESVSNSRGIDLFSWKAFDENHG